VVKFDVLAESPNKIHVESLAKNLGKNVQILSQVMQKIPSRKLPHLFFHPNMMMFFFNPLN